MSNRDTTLGDYLADDSLPDPEHDVDQDPYPATVEALRESLTPPDDLPAPRTRASVTQFSPPSTQKHAGSLYHLNRPDGHLGYLTVRKDVDQHRIKTLGPRRFAQTPFYGAYAVSDTIVEALFRFNQRDTDHYISRILVAEQDTGVVWEYVFDHWPAADRVPDRISYGEDQRYLPVAHALWRWPHEAGRLISVH